MVPQIVEKQSFPKNSIIFDFLGISGIKAKPEGQVLGTTSQAISLQRKETVKDTRIITFFRSLFGKK